MVRSMYSGVSGLRTHQTRMDTIGNNIANVNTYGFKSGRTTFRDIYYQGMSSASAPTAALGGMNPSAVGYGSKVGSVDLMMSRSTFTMTDQTMDLAIDGDGFFQVQDGAGNIYYTRAGMLNFDAAGNLVDMQGNYVLGINGDPSGQPPGSSRISVSLPDVQPAPASVVQTINGKEFTISASNNTTDSNLNMTFTTDSKVTDGEIQAEITTTGIIIKMNPDNVYNNVGELNTAINQAIYRANGNKEHAAGNFTVTYTGTGTDPFAGGLKASEITSTDYGVQKGSLTFGAGYSVFGGMTPNGVGNTFSSTGTISNLESKYFSGTPAYWEIKMTMSDGKVYTGTVDENRTGTGEFKLEEAGGDADDYILMKRPSFNDITDAYITESGGPAPTGGESFAAQNSTTLGNPPAATASYASRNLGFSSTAFALRGGTAGGPQTIADMTGIQIAPNGIITGWDSQGTEITIGRIDVVTFANPSGLNQAGSSNYTVSSNSGEPIINQPGTNGAGKLVGGSLEMSNVDLSREFSDMITTQRGYQANSRIITVSDTMLEELINLKR